MIVTDAPYGVAHGSRTDHGLSRSPLELLTAAVPVWRELLRPGGALGLSWNTHVAPRAQAEAVLADAGLRVLDGPGFGDFATGSTRRSSGTCWWLSRLNRVPGCAARRTVARRVYRNRTVRPVAPG